MTQNRQEKSKKQAERREQGRSREEKECQEQRKHQGQNGREEQKDLAEPRTIWLKIQEKYAEANFLQSPEWQRMNELVGHKVVIEHFADEAWCLMIVKNARRGRYLEIPGGPLLNWEDDALVRRMFALIRKVAVREKCVFVRIRPQLLREKEFLLDDLGLRKAPMHLHAEHTVMLDLTKSGDELLAGMRRQTRYEVRRSEKLAIKVEKANDQKIFKEFHSVQAETALRQNFVPPDLKTLLAEREAFGDQAWIYRAEVSKKTLTDGKNPDAKVGDSIAYGLILISGREADYFEAASTDLNRKLPGAYALQWQVIKDLKQRGVERYNLWGVAPSGQKQHRYAGVTTFKTGFGGEMVEFVPAQDLVIKPVRYGIDWIIETIRKKRRHL